jgi:hypothetical protein
VAPTRHHSNLRRLVAEPLHLDDSLQHPTPTTTAETHLNAVATVVDSTAWIDAGSRVQCVSTAYNRGTACTSTKCWEPQPAKALNWFSRTSRCTSSSWCNRAQRVRLQC